MRARHAEAVSRHLVRRDGRELLRAVGANGSGKTSLLRILCGLASPSAGVVRWKGQPIGALREEYARELVYIGTRRQ